MQKKIDFCRRLYTKTFHYISSLTLFLHYMYNAILVNFYKVLALLMRSNAINPNFSVWVKCVRWYRQNKNLNRQSIETFIRKQKKYSLLNIHQCCSKRNGESHSQHTQ
ncbi:helicase, UvrD/Rep/AddA family domain protein [Wolbachia pipientis wUni]|nr:helicase, UvrD/Rep/AddA family domain protein [Wolbachia pipientis wUni]